MIGRLLPPAAAVIGLSLAPILPCAGASGRSISLSLCGRADTAIRIPIGDGTPPRDEDRPLGCHAACLRKHLLDDDLSVDS